MGGLTGYGDVNGTDDTVTYDDRGNIATYSYSNTGAGANSDGTITYGYDAADELTSLAENGGSTHTAPYGASRRLEGTMDFAPLSICGRRQMSWTPRSDYTVAMSSSSPRSVRFDATVNARLSAYVARHPGSSGSSVANGFVDEALRMDEHPGVIFRGGRTGRRAVLVGGPDVREVVRAVKSARTSEPDLDPADVIALVETNTGVPGRLVDVAVRYWSSYPQEIDAWIADADSIEAEALAAWERQQDLLAR